MFAEHSKCRSKCNDEELLVELSGEIDHHTAVSVREHIDKEVMKHRPQTLILSLGGVSFMDSSGLGLILGRYALCEELGVSMRLCEVNARIMKMLTMAGVERVTKIKIEKKREK